MKLKEITKKERARRIVKSIEKHRGNLTAVAREEGTSRQNIYNKVNRTYVEQERIDQLEKSGATIERHYKKHRMLLDCKDLNIVDKAINRGLKLYGHLKDTEAPPIIISDKTEVLILYVDPKNPRNTISSPLRKSE